MSRFHATGCNGSCTGVACMSVPVLSYENGRDRRPWWKPYAAAVAPVLAFSPLLIPIVYWTWPESPGGTDARRPDPWDSVQTLRSTIVLFKLQHNDRLPGVCPLVDSGG